MLDKEKSRESDIIDFWKKEKSKWKGDDWSNMSSYVISKFDRMNSSEVMRSILGAKKSTINIKEIMDNGKILLVSLPKGLLGEVNANLLGMIISTKIRLSILSRATVDENLRRPFYFFIDEFQNFVSTSGFSYSKDGYDEAFTSMITEARKYKTSLILANQHLEQLGHTIRRALFGNIGSLVAFKAGVEDSRYLSSHFTDKISANDFITIPIYHAYANLLQDGESLPPFTIETIPVKDIPADIERKEKIIEQSRKKYGITLQMKKPVTELDLSVRALSCLEYAKIKTVGELVTKEEDELLKLENFGRTTLVEIKKKLNQLGLSFKVSDDVS